MGGKVATRPALERLQGWFSGRGWTPFTFQRKAWAAYRNRQSGLIHAPTGLGKTYAVWGGLLLEGLEAGEAGATPALPPSLRLLWITPLRALAGDTAESLRRPLDDLGLPWSVEVRTGDTSSSVKRRQRRRLPTALITTPESLSLLLSYPDWKPLFQGLRCVVVDEWHELLGTKRGVQAELGIARLKSGLERPPRVWGLSATLGNLAQAGQVLLGEASVSGKLIQGVADKRIEIDTLIPQSLERFPWAGHLGLRLLPQVIEQIEKARTTLVFTNTRSQTEIWFRSLVEERPDWAGCLAAHHGSIGKEIRDSVEARLKTGDLKAVVCTSSLDLGVDFSPVDQVIQIGSPKGVARLMQRAGRSGHQPGAVSRIVGVPTNGFELVEFAAARNSMLRGAIESRLPLEQPLDVLLQHIVTCGLGGGFHREALYHEIRTTYAYRELGEEVWNWCLDFASRGGEALKAYPQFSKLACQGETYWLEDRRLSQQHRMSIGTITSDAEVQIVLQKGGRLGSVEESFISRLNPGAAFSFAGRRLKLVRFKDLKATVQPAKQASGAVPNWQGGRSPLSTELADSVRRTLEGGVSGRKPSPEMVAARPLLEVQAAWSKLPQEHDLLVERTPTRNGLHTSFFPFAGRLVHEGLAALVAHRLSREIPLSIRVTPNDYGFSLLTRKSFPLNEGTIRTLFSGDRLLEDLLECLNETELARRQFREIARVAGLVLQGFPGNRKSHRQVQVSSGLLFDVFDRYDPENLLLHQARREVLERQLEFTRLQRVIQGLKGKAVSIQLTDRLTPLSFPLWADQIGETLSSETRLERIEGMLSRLESLAGDSPR